MITNPSNLTDAIEIPVTILPGEKTGSYCQITPI